MRRTEKQSVFLRSPAPVAIATGVIGILDVRVFFAPEFQPNGHKHGGGDAGLFVLDAGSLHFSRKNTSFSFLIFSITF